MPSEPGLTRRPRLGRSGSTELAEVLALPGVSPYGKKGAKVRSRESNEI